MTSVNDKTMQFNRRIRLNFEGGNLTSDAGLLLNKEFDDKIGLSKLIQRTVVLKDTVDNVAHSNVKVIMQKVYQHVAGYHADDDADTLRLILPLPRFWIKKNWPRSPQYQESTNTERPTIRIIGTTKYRS